MGVSARDRGLLCAAARRRGAFYGALEPSFPRKALPLPQTDTNVMIETTKMLAQTQTVEKRCSIPFASGLKCTACRWTDTAAGTTGARALRNSAQPVRAGCSPRCGSVRRRTLEEGHREAGEQRRLRGDRREVGVEEVELFLAKLDRALLHRAAQQQLVCGKHLWLRGRRISARRIRLLSRRRRRRRCKRAAATSAPPRRSSVSHMGTRQV